MCVCESGKKVRRGSSEERCAITDLRKAILDAADRFSRHEEFSAWLCKNHCYHIDGYDPQRVSREFLRKLEDLQWRVECLEEGSKLTDKHLLEIALQTTEDAERGRVAVEE